MERIAQLDSEVNQLKQENSLLLRAKEKMTEEAKDLKVQISKHFDSGCIIQGVTRDWNSKIPDSTS